MIVQITNNWQSLNALAGIPVGTAFTFQSQTSNDVFVQESATVPSYSSADAALVQPLTWYQATVGSQAIYVKSAGLGGQLFVEQL